MRSFIIVTFAFLGFAFYVLSGGAGYVPAPNSIQARAAHGSDGAARIETAAVADIVPVRQEIEQDAQSVTRAASSLSDLTARRTSQGDGARFELTLASVDRQGAQNAAQPDVTAATTLAESVAIEAAIEEAVSTPLSLDEDIAELIPQGVFSLETYVAIQGQGQTFGATPVARPISDRREVSGENVNMRAGPGTDYERVGALSKGMQVIVLEEPGNGWLMLEVVETGETGWMADWLVTASN